MDLICECVPRRSDLAESCDIFMYKGFSLPSFAVRFLHDYAPTFEAREDDLYLVSYPKTGTTWLQEIVFLVVSDLDFKTAKGKSLDERFPFLEHAKTDVATIEQSPSPRLIKSHLPYSVLPPDILKKKCKIIYVTRNPKDIVVSYFHFAKVVPESKYQGTFSQFFERFLLSRPTYSPFPKHNLEFWSHRNDENLLFLFYEDMQRDLFSVVKKIAKFLGKDLTEKEINEIVNHCTFKNMSKNEQVVRPGFSSIDGDAGKFFRKGKVGDWKNYFTEEQNKRMNKWIEDALHDTGLSFVYEL